ncbi:MAG: glycosyltransferase family 1 protein, partial [Actinomycetota bacterium]|nr:glycosyltransferase family 1 protein [Actinomycetota bacterium]
MLTWFRSNDEMLNRGMVSTVASAGRAVHSRREVAGVDQMIKAYRPDVVHVHNTLPLLSPSVIRPATKRG